ncbi:MAG: hypothetical protein R3E11_00450 [Sphingobium sp.]|nr:hypothetical protein [Sphingomonas sp.]
MWVRVAYWLGKPKDGVEEEFVHGVNTIVIPGLQALPGVLGAEALWPCQSEDNAPDVYGLIHVHFNSAADIDDMLASPERTAFREKIVGVVELFEGRLSHVNYEVAA